MITISIPMLPGKALSPNWHGHWATRAREARLLRGITALAAKAACPVEPPQFDRAEVSVTYVIRDRRGYRDADNALASIKPAIDGLVDARIVKDDSQKHLTYRLPIIFQINRNEAPALILEVKGKQ